MRRSIRRLGVLAVAACLLVAPSALAQRTYDFQKLILDNTDKPDPDRLCYERPFWGWPFTWTNGSRFLMVHAGVDLLVYGLDAPGTLPLSKGGFGLGWGCVPSGPEARDPGDTGARGLTAILSSIDQLERFSVCDGCRFGVLYDSTGVGQIFDLGTGSVPSFTGKWSYSGVTWAGAYRVGSTEYLVGIDTGTQGCGSAAAPQTGVWTVTPRTPPLSPTLTKVQCQDTAAFAPKVLYQRGDLLFYLEGTQLEVATIGANGVPDPPAASFKVNTPVDPGAPPFSVDMGDYASGGAGYLLTFDYWDSTGTARLYRFTDANGDGVPEFGTPLVLNPGRSPAWWYSGAVRYPYVFVMENGTYVVKKALYQVSWDAGSGWTLAQTPEDDAYFNDPGSDFNTAAKGTDDLGNPRASEQGAAFSFDGNGLFFFRYYQAAYFQLAVPQPPTASLAVTPDPALPGDQITLTVTTSPGTYTQWAAWITDGSGAKVAGYDTTNPQPAPASPVTFPIPLDLALSQSYTAHVWVKNDLGTDQTDQAVNLDRTPQVTIAGAPSSVLTNTTVTLSANAEGTPSAATSDPYGWVATRPDQSTVTGSGTSFSLALDTWGTWTVDLRAEYAHEAPAGTDLDGDGLYEDDAPQVSISVSSVVPVVSVDPAAPTPDDTVTLKATGSQVAENVTADYAYLLDGASQCTGQVTGGPGGSVTIPDCALGTLAEGSYTAELELTPHDGSPVVTSDPVSFDVVAVGFTISPASPQIGEEVTFTLSGSPSLVNGWDFGETHCDGTSSFLDCSRVACPGTLTWRYPTSGTKTVTLYLRSGGTIQKTLDVQPTGSCPATCTPVLTPTSVSFPASGGTKSVSLSVGATCSWTVTDSATWLSVSPTSGTGTRTLALAATANTGGTRNATVTVTASPGGKVVSIPVSQAAGGAGSVDFTFSPSNPQIGQTVTFTITAGGPATQWSFGGADCDGNAGFVDCSRFVGGCGNTYTWSYADPGTHTVKLTTASGTKTRTITVASAGSCPCTYQLSDPQGPVPGEGGSGQLQLSTGDGCPWTVTSGAGWLAVSPPSGTGSATLTYTAQANDDTSERQAAVSVKDGQGTVRDTVTVTQEGGSGFQVGPFLVPAVASASGVGGIAWRSDLRVFNPSDQAQAVTLTYLPRYGDGGSGSTQRTLQPGETWWVQDAVQLLTGEPGHVGSVKVDFAQTPRPPVVASRTFTPVGDGSSGTYGQLIPVVPDPELARPGEVLVIPGVEHSAGYRTNVGLANPTDTGTGVTVRLYDAADGTLVGEAGYGVPAGQSIQLPLDAVVPGLVDFTGSVEVWVTNGGGVTAYGSVVDQATGDPVYIGAERAVNPAAPEQVQAQAAALAADFTISNTTPQIGEEVTFTITSGGPAQRWEFGGFSCDGYEGILDCTRVPCPATVTFTYRDAGPKTVTLTAAGGTVSHTLEVQAAGSCPGGSCTYSLSPTYSSFPAEGGSGEVTVTTQDGCPWTAQANVGWIHITSGASGSGPGTVSYTVDANDATGNRQGSMTIAGKTFVVSQSAPAGGGGGGGGGGGTASELLVPAVASASGLGGIQWRSDLRIYNPGAQPLKVHLEFLPRYGDSAAAATISRWVLPKATVWIADVVQEILGEGGHNGSVRVTWDDSDTVPVVVSRTFTPVGGGAAGTFGQLIPAVADTRLARPGRRLVIPGVEHSSAYRTNVGLANPGDAGTGVTVHVYDASGSEVGSNGYGIPAGQSIQLPLSAIATLPAEFRGSVVIEVTNGSPVTAYASVVDQATGDPIYIQAVRQ